MCMYMYIHVHTHTYIYIYMYIYIWLTSLSNHLDSFPSALRTWLKLYHSHLNMDQWLSSNISMRQTHIMCAHTQKILYDICIYIYNIYIYIKYIETCAQACKNTDI